MRTVLSVNLNKIALIRNSRPGNFPDLLEFGRLALYSGAGGLTIHPRPDQRHARYSDMADLKELVLKHPGCELNIEGYPDPKLVSLVLELKPHQFTLVPDHPSQLTSDHGWDLRGVSQEVLQIISQVQAVGTRCSLFLDPDPMQVQLAASSKACRVEFYTGPYAKAYQSQNGQEELQKLIVAANEARRLGLQINAGHDLNLLNLKALVDAIHPDEVSIGHALTIDALRAGFSQAVKQYLACL